MCTCKDKSQWWVRHWKAYWHYIGKRRTYRRSKSSLIECKGCQKSWRTTAKYVAALPKKYDTPYLTCLTGDIVWNAE
jgi:hypothetical protein